MRNGSLLVAIAAGLVLSAPVLAQDTDTAVERPDRGDRVERRLDRQGDVVDRRLDRAARRAHDADRDRVARHLDRRGDQVDRRLDRRGRQADRRIDRRTDRRGERRD